MSEAFQKTPLKPDGVGENSISTSFAEHMLEVLGDQEIDPAVPVESGAVRGLEAVAAPGNGVRHLGPYLLLEELGRGGQGQVFLAEDSRLSRKVARKVLSSS
ncbi:MAG: hypothetical protein HY717_23195 [Planctomycetes bacterium]|nr:hypothetical protein [Planctomycetota bacterium]